MKYRAPTLFLLSLLAACGAGQDPVSRAQPTTEPGAAVDLTTLDPTALTVAPDSRGGARPRREVPVTGWELVRSNASGKTWEAPLPVRPRALFFSRPLPGMQLTGPDGAIPHARSSRRGANWAFNAETITLDLPMGSAGPTDTSHTLRYPNATRREAALNRAFSTAGSDLDFVRTEVQAGPESYTGLLLPAPSQMRFQLTVPAAGELVFSRALVAPETADLPASDGADLQVSVNGQLVSTVSVEGTDFSRAVVDLSSFAGQQVELTLATDPRGSAVADYVFLAEPVVVSRQTDPKRIAFVFVDTLRPDHLGLYGYERDTTPVLDAWSKSAVVFDNAHSVAPWTLPSARTMLTGRYPAEYQDAVSLPTLLREQGWATAMLAGNVYLSANFEVNRGWGRHRAENWPAAEIQVDRALAWMTEHEGQDQLLLLHFMDPHLPYVEPAEFRHAFAGDAVKPLGEEFHRGHITRGRLSPEAKQYVQDRYDNNIRYVDSQLERLFAALDEDDLVLFVADHGEEFWEHTGFEHGHTLYEEVVRIPMLLKAPGTQHHRVAEPASLLDVTPTLLDYAGVTAADLDGKSLLPLTRGPQPELQQSLAERPLALGHPLYGSERWGVVYEGHKYTATEGREALFDHATDLGEHDNLVANQPIAVTEKWRTAMGDASGRPTAVSYRLVNSQGRATEDLVVEMTVPGGIAAAWVGDDPTNGSAATLAVEGEVATVTWPRGMGGSREVYVVPREPLEVTTPKLQLNLRAGDDTATGAAHEDASPIPSERRIPLYKAEVGGRRFALTWGIGPVPVEGITALEGDDAELRDMLKAMGYAVGDDEEPEDDAE